MTEKLFFGSLSIVILLSLALPIAGQQAAPGAPSVLPERQRQLSTPAPSTLDARGLNVGSVVAIGRRNPNNGACTYDRFSVGVNSSTPRTFSINLQNDDQCRLVVTEKRDEPYRPLNLTPQNPIPRTIPRRVGRLIPPLNPLLQDAAIHVEAGYSTNPFQAFMRNAVWNSTRPKFQPVRQSSQITVSQYVFSYGYGGPSVDKLTGDFGWMRFSYDGTNAWISSNGGYCDAPGAFNGWVVDSCQFDGWDAGPNTIIWQQGSGNYHWEPTYYPPSYYHILIDKEYGTKNGGTQCVFDYLGDVVLGVGSNCSVS